MTHRHALEVLQIVALWLCVAMSDRAWCQVPDVDESNNPTKLGIADHKPVAGPYVPIRGGSGGYMVPYVQLLGETDIKFEMIPVPGGIVKVGSPIGEAGRKADEGLQFEVALEPYWVGKTEVTWREYQAFMKMHDIFKRSKRLGIRKVDSKSQADAVTVPTPLYAPATHMEWTPTLDHPAVTMTQYAAKQYTKWLSGVTQIQYRLPTEAEWEYAARAGSNAAYCFGDDVAELDRYAVYDSKDGASVVGSKAPNAYGLHDMHGNVWEWTVEEYSPDGYVEQYGHKWKGHEGTRWPTQATSLCVRGGCWADNAERVRSAVRMGSSLDDWNAEDPESPNSPWWHTSDPARMVGMRIVRSMKPLELNLIRKFWEAEVMKLRDDINVSLQEGRGIEGLPMPEVLKELKALRQK